MPNIYEKIGEWLIMAPDHDLYRRPISVGREGVSVTMTPDEAEQVAHAMLRITKRYREEVEKK